MPLSYIFRYNFSSDSKILRGSYVCITCPLIGDPLVLFLPLKLPPVYDGLSRQACLAVANAIFIMTQHEAAQVRVVTSGQVASTASFQELQILYMSLSVFSYQLQNGTTKLSHHLLLNFQSSGRSLPLLRKCY